MKNPHITGLFNPVIPSPLLIIYATTVAAISTIKEHIPTAGQYHLGVDIIELSRSLLICSGGKILPSCMEVIPYPNFYSGLANTK